MVKRIQIFVCILAISLLAGCSLFGGGEDETQISDDVSVRQLYERANGFLASGNYTEAIKSYELLESRYPFGEYAQLAQLELAYAYYKQSEPDIAIFTANRFIKLNPLHKNVDYAYYIKGLANFYRNQHLLSFIIPRDPSDTDPTPLQNSFNDFELLVNKYPDSRYAEDATQRMIFLRNKLAESEVKIADFYLRKKAYLAAANRAKFIMEKYQGAPIMPSAVAILEQSYRGMGLDSLADDAQRLYAANYTEQDLVRSKYGYYDEDCGRGIWNGFLNALAIRDANCR